MSISQRSSVKSADRVLDILELLASTGRSMTHAEIARRNRIPKSSLTHLLRNLAERGYAEAMEGSLAFRLGDGAFALARRGAHTRELVELARPCLERLTAATGESSGMSLLHDDMAERICSVDSTHAVLYAMHVGVRAPLYANSGGKIFLAWMTAAEREAYFSRVKLVPLTDRTILSLGVLRRQLQRIRTEGFAYSMGEFTSASSVSRCPSWTFTDGSLQRWASHFLPPASTTHADSRSRKHCAHARKPSAAKRTPSRRVAIEPGESVHACEHVVPPIAAAWQHFAFKGA